jgi:hypothetical protein
MCIDVLELGALYAKSRALLLKFLFFLLAPNSPPTAGGSRHEA